MFLRSPQNGSVLVQSSNQIMTKLLLSPTSGDNPRGSFSPVILCKYLFHCMAAYRCDDLITSLLFHNSLFQTSVLIYYFSRASTENEAVDSQELKKQSRKTVAFCDIHPWRAATDESTKQLFLWHWGRWMSNTWCWFWCWGKKYIWILFTLYRVNT